MACMPRRPTTGVHHGRHHWPVSAALKCSTNNASRHARHTWPGSAAYYRIWRVHKSPRATNNASRQPRSCHATRPRIGLAVVIGISQVDVEPPGRLVDEFRTRISNPTHLHT
ncbi:hypothetical protein JB92DRAFT_3010977 [Gautieria morchelliformis]|nr:hypothetical protein JB92DRAFT_3010977 [Gautieria morchelliformis]